MNIDLESRRPNFGLDAALGAISGITPRWIWGTATPTTAWQDVWGQQAVGPLLAAATALSISSSSANDAAAGTGARTVTLEGLDENYAEISETLTLNGQTEVTGSLTFLRLLRAYVVTAGSGGVNAGDIYVYDDADTPAGGVPGTPASYLVGKILAGDNIANQATYTVPAGKTLAVLGINLGCYDTAARYNRLRIASRAYGGLWQYRHLSGLVTAASTDGWKSLAVPLVFPEKTEVRVQCLASAAGSTIMVGLACVEIQG